MKFLFRNTIAAIAVVATFSACINNDFDAPDYVALPNGETFTISDIYAIYNKRNTSFEITDTAYLYATVIGDEGSGNLYKQLYVQDETGGINLQMEESAANVRVGDYIKIVLNGLAVSSYNDLLQISKIEPAYDIIVQRNECFIQPEVVTIEQLNNSNFAFTSKLIKLENVQFIASDTTGTYADGYALTSQNRTLTDSLGNEVIVRSSGYANFANKKVISGCGDAIFIVSRYSSTIQLLIRNINELNLTGKRFAIGNEGSTIFYQSFESDFGNFTTYNVKGDQVWNINYSTATMTGYANSTNFENEDWLISPEIDLTNETVAAFSMEYIARYFNDLNNDITLQVSTNYETGKEPSSATWTTIPASWVSGADWNTFATTNVDISQFAGKKVHVAVKYSSTATKAGTLEVKSISVLNKIDGQQQHQPTSDEVVFTQSFGSDFGTFATYNLNGDQVWGISYNTATMTGFADNTNYVNEDWLVSSEIDLTSCTAASFSMEYIARYFSNLNSDITLQISTDYQQGANPTTAKWTTVSAQWESGADWKTFATTNVDISAFAGQKIVVAVKYSSTATKAGTIEIKQISILNKAAENQGTAPNPTPSTTNDGSFNNPLSVTEAMTATGTKWVKGYIVGVYETKDASGATLEKYQMSTAAPFYTNTNLLIAATSEEQTLANCMTVQLPKGDIRDAINLVDNAAVLGKEVMLYGSLEKYFSMPGIKSLTGYWLDGAGINPENGTSTGGNTGGNTSTDTDAIFAESFSKDQGQFTIHDVEIGSLNYVWKWASANYGIKASAYYNKTNNVAESWLVSPAIDLSSVNEATLSFQQAANFVATPSAALHVMVSTNFDGDIANANWSELDIEKWPTGSDYTFVTSIVDISDFAGETIYIAFQYTSTSNEAATWEVKDLKIK